MNGILADCDVRVKVKKGALWRRVSHVALGKENDPAEDDAYLELNSDSHRPVIIDLVQLKMRLLVFPGRFEVVKFDEDEISRRGP